MSLYPWEIDDWRADAPKLDECDHIRCHAVEEDADEFRVCAACEETLCPTHFGAGVTKCGECLERLLDAATRDAIVLLLMRVDTAAPAPSEADCFLLDALHHLERRVA